MQREEFYFSEFSVISVPRWFDLPFLLQLPCHLREDTLPKIAVAGLWHETHTFANTRTTLADFQRFEWAEGEAMISLFRGTRTSVGGYIDGAQQCGLELVPVFYAGATPSGLVTSEAYSKLESRLLDGLRGIGPVDGVL